VCSYIYGSECAYGFGYGVASVSRIDKIVGLFCKRALYKRHYSAKETCNVIDRTTRSHPIRMWTSSTDRSVYGCGCVGVGVGAGAGVGVGLGVGVGVGMDMDVGVGVGVDEKHFSR